MVDVGPKPATRRVAVASGSLRVSKELSRRIRRGGVDKGDPLEISRVAGIAAAKRASDLLPLCHPIAITSASVDVRLADPGRVEIRATVEARDRTGVEMEALTAVAVACLCFYDVCKKHDRSMTIERIALEEKSGGRSGTYRRGGNHA
jgi:cyclic pyranopterin phosphate synthase